MSLNLNIYNRLIVVGIVVLTSTACSSTQVEIEQAKAVQQIQPSSIRMTRKKPIALTTFKGHSERVTSVVFSPDGQSIASASYDDTVKLWNPRSGQVIRTFSVRTSDEDHNQEYKLWIEASSKLSFSQDGTILTLGNGYNALISWQVNTGQVVKKVRGRSSYTLGTAFSPDGIYFANALDGLDKTLSASDLTTLSFNEISERLVQSARSQDTGEIGIWDVRNGKQISTFSQTGLSQSIAFSSDNQFVLASSSSGSRVSLWDLKSGRLLRTWQGFGSVAISPNNEFVAATGYGSDDCKDSRFDTRTHNEFVATNRYKVWNRETGKEIYSFEGERGEGQALAFSPDSKILAASLEESNTITLLDLITGQKLATLSSPQVVSIAISPNNELIASGNFDNTVRVWKMQ